MECKGRRQVVLKVHYLPLIRRLHLEIGRVYTHHSLGCIINLHVRIILTKHLLFISIIVANLKLLVFGINPHMSCPVERK
jgi:hypothetical protein